MKKTNKLKVVIVLLILILIIFLVIKGITKINANNEIEVAEQKNVLNYNEIEQENKLVNNIQNKIEDNNFNNIQNSNSLQNTNPISEEKLNTNEIESMAGLNEVNNSSEKTNTNDTIKSDENKPENTKNENNSKSNTSSDTKDVKFDSSVAFIGDSRTQGFIMYNGLKEVQDYSYVGLMVDTAITKKIVKTSNGEKITLLQDMKNKNIKTVYIMLGLNELGWSYPQVFKLKYNELIDEIRKVQPNCKIYVQSIIPVTKTKDKSDKIFNNKNVEKFNKLIQEVANEKNVKYLDVGSALKNKDGYLPEEASTDGIHISPKYCKKWLEYLRNNSQE